MFSVCSYDIQIIKKPAEFQHSLAKNELKKILWFDFVLKARKH
jgi:hypothetical protein